MKAAAFATLILLGLTTGIGTSSPNAPLEVKGNAGSGETLRLTPAAAATVEGGQLTLMDASGAGGWEIDNAGGVGASANLRFFRDKANTVNAMVLTPAGNVGIGTTSPTSLLHVNSSGLAELTISGGSTDYVNAGLVLKSTTDTNYRGSGVYMHDAGGQNEWFAGRPYASSDNYVIARKASLATHDTAVAQYANSLLTVSSAGNVGIGTTTPNAKLEVNGTFRASGSITNGGFDFLLGTADQTSRGNSGASRALVKLAGPALGVNYNGDFTGGTVVHGAGGTPNLFVSGASNGNVGVGTTNPTYRLQSAGQVAGAGAYVNTSDGRLKTNVHDLDYSLDKVMRLRPVSFQWKDQNEDWQKGRKLGLIAQEAEGVVPEVVSTANDGMGTKSIAYGDLTPVLVKAVQELKAETDNLTLAIEELREEIEALRAVAR